MNALIDAKWGEKSPMHDPYILANFNARPSDVLITTAPKAGTTWMQQILYQLKSGGDSRFSYIDDVVPWLELPRHQLTREQQLEKYERLGEPRIFKTHCTYPQTPGVDCANIILSSRDPRDCCISFYHHLMAMTDQAFAYIGVARPDSFDEYFENWLTFGAWYRNVKSWWPHINDSNVLWLRYEDMVNNLENCIDRILLFLNWSLADDARATVLTHCSFAWMKQHNEKFATRFESGQPMFKADSFIRKGKVGDHKNGLSPQQEQRILERARQELPEDCLEFIGLA